MRILVTGASGFLGTALGRACLEQGHRPCSTSRRASERTPQRHQEADLCESAATDRILDTCEPDVVIHAAARADATACLLDPAAAREINAEVPRRLAEACALRGVRLLHVSTDLVFSGEAAPYRENDLPTPLSVYGRTKYLGEEGVLAAGGNCLVVRIPLLFGPSPDRKRGASDMLRRVHTEGRLLTLFTDEIRSPLHVDTAARCLVTLATGEAHGILHVAARTSISRYALGRACLQALELPLDLVQPGLQRDFPARETRPPNVSLHVQRAISQFGLELPTALEEVGKLRTKRATRD